MKISMTQHGLDRLFERTYMTTSDLQKIVDEEQYVRIGYDLNKKNVCHWLTRSKSKNELFVLVVDEVKMELITVLFADVFNNWMIDPVVIDCVRRGDFKLEEKNAKKKKPLKSQATPEDELINLFNEVFENNKDIRKLNKFCTRDDFQKLFAEAFEYPKHEQEWVVLYRMYQDKHFPNMFGRIRQDLIDYAQENWMPPSTLSKQNFNEIIKRIESNYKFHIPRNNSRFYKLCMEWIKSNKKRTDSIRKYPMRELIEKHFRPVWIESFDSHDIFEVANRDIIGTFKEAGFYCSKDDCINVRDAYIFMYHTVSFDRLINLLKEHNLFNFKGYSEFCQAIKKLGFGKINNQKIMFQKMKHYQFFDQSIFNCAFEIKFNDGLHKFYYFKRDYIIVSQAEKEPKLLDIMKRVLEYYTNKGIDISKLKSITFYKEKLTSKGVDIIQKELFSN